MPKLLILDRGAHELLVDAIWGRLKVARDDREPTVDMVEAGNALDVQHEGPYDLRPLTVEISHPARKVVEAAIENVLELEPELEETLCWLA